jgi:hypothetical protein
MVSIVIYICQTRSVDPDIKRRLTPLKFVIELLISPSVTPQFRATAMAAVRFSILIIPGNGNLRSLITPSGLLRLKRKIPLGF